MVDEDSNLTDLSVSGEGYSHPLRVATETGARLNTPEKASISRERKVQRNPAEKKRNVRGTAEPNVSAWDRLNQFKGEHLKNLRCDARKDTVSTKKSSVMKHIASQETLNQRHLLRKARKKTRVLWT